MLICFENCLLHNWSLILSLFHLVLDHGPVMLLKTVYSTLLKVQKYFFIYLEIHLWTHSKLYKGSFFWDPLDFKQNMIWKCIFVCYLGVPRDVSSKCPLKTFKRYWKHVNNNEKLFWRCISRNFPEAFQSNVIVLTS